MFGTSSSSPLDFQPREMELSLKFGGQLTKVKLEPLDASLPELGQQQECNDSSSGDNNYGATRGMIQIKEEPREESSDEHQIIEVKTEPYNTAILDQVGHSHDSTSEGAKESSGGLHIKDELRSSCDHASSGWTSSSAQFETSTTTVEPLFENVALVTLDGRPTEQSSDQSETQVAGKSSTFGHEKDRLYKCSVGLATCIDTGLLEDDLKPHKTKTFTSDMCSAAISHASTLQVHAKHSMGVSLHKSKICAFACASSASKCNLTPAESSHTMCLRHHKQTHMGKKRYRCDLCPAEFGHYTSLCRHKRKHTSVKRYKCNLCPAEFSNSEKLHDHKRTHTSQRPYKCNLCPAQFGHSTILKCHKQRHTGEKPYKCDLCSAEFSLSSSLYDHRGTHRDVKPNKCDLCPAEFKKRDTLQCHRRSHTGEKPYKCDVCIAAFSRSSSLLRHKWTHMGNKPHKCDLCPAVRQQDGPTVPQANTHGREAIQVQCLPCGVQPHYESVISQAKTHRREAL
ncbi:zinc finger protein 62-like [Ornithodoros turicata]|uniref:zinc finger protein 62-like n=1 Tax=Ornithodoros turicata TaxID=34597 RepID=UPI00313962C8